MTPFQSYVLCRESLVRCDHADVHCLFVTPPTRSNGRSADLQSLDSPGFLVGYPG